MCQCNIDPTTRQWMENHKTTRHIAYSIAAAVMAVIGCVTYTCVESDPRTPHARWVDAQRDKVVRETINILANTDIGNETKAITLAWHAKVLNELAHKQDTGPPCDRCGEVHRCRLDRREKNDILR